MASSVDSSAASGYGGDPLPPPDPRVASTSGDAFGSRLATGTIPRVSKPESTPRTTPKGTPGPDVGLPEGVTVPPSVDHSLLQGRLLDTLKRLPPHLITDALNEYDEAVKNKGDQIRSHGAYLYGVIKRYNSVQERAQTGAGSGAMGLEVTPAVNARLHKLVADGFCTEEEMNDKIKGKIRMLSETDALFAIDELSSVQRDQIRNFSSYFMGLLNRHMREPGNRSSKRHSSSYGGRESRRYDDRGGRDRDYRRRRDDSPPRGRSYRDRYGSRDDRDYDSRYRRERSRDRYDDNRRSNTGHSDYRRSSTDHSYHRDSRSSRYDDPRQSQSQSAGQQGAYGAPSSVPPPPPPRATSQPPPQMAGLIGTFTPQQQQAFIQLQQQESQPQQQTQQVLQLQTPQQQFVPQTLNQQAVPGTFSSSSSALASAPGGFLSSSAPTSAPGAFVASSVQQSGGYPSAALGAQAGAFNTTQQTILPQNTSGQQLNLQQTQATSQYLGSPAAAPPASTNTWQSQGQAIPDILGLADRAAQALASQNALRPAAATTAPPIAPMPAHQSSTNYYINSAAPAPSPVRSGRTTATMSELSPMVQFAVKNLLATGHIDGELDGGILGMIRDIPEPVALQSLEKFSSIDTSTMRNKTAYLAGILRRELAKLSRR